MGRIRLKRVEVDKPVCSGCFFKAPAFGKMGQYRGLSHCNKRKLRSEGHNLRDLFDCDDFRCELDMQNFIFIKY